VLIILKHSKFEYFEAGIDKLNEGGVNSNNRPRPAWVWKITAYGN
jgi:hypothetical protein